MKPLSLLIALGLVAPASCQACAVVAEMTGDPNIHIADESALIVWDAKTHTEQFVRRADFESEKAKNFGFIVPTPSRPTLGEAQEGVFTFLEAELKPEVKHQSYNPYIWTLWDATRPVRNTFSSSADMMDGTEDFEFIEQKRVAGYDATVLRATDAQKLKHWLRAHHYATTANFEEWIASYTKRGWYLTAFKIAANSDESAHAKAVRLTFKTDAPFYPYREPKSSRTQTGERALRLFYVAANRPDARIKNESKQEAWPIEVEYSAPVKSSVLKGQHLSLPAGPLRLTSFADSSSPRPGWGDLVFSPSADQSEKKLPPVIEWHKQKAVYVPLDLALLAINIIGGIWWLRRQRQRTTEKHLSAGRATAETGK